MRDERTTTWRLFQIEQGIRESDRSLRSRACREIGVDEAELRGFRIARRSVDARRKRLGLRFSCHVDLILAEGFRSSSLDRAERAGRVRRAPVDQQLTLDRIAVPDGSRVVVVGSGPAGLFSALTLALNGMQVTLVDRGSSLERRGTRLVAFHRNRVVDPETNLLFGEGGAGTYSDGKVYTRVDDPLEVPCLQVLVDAGAPGDILFDSRAHIGTDRLHRVLPRLRTRMESLGVSFAWETRMESLVFETKETRGTRETTAGSERRVRGIRTTQGEIEADAVFLALGHSARDSWTALHAQGVRFEAKPFQFGVRIEHPQELITRGQYGSGPDVAALGPASYAMVCKASGGSPSAHSFCMCPGGRIVASVNEAGSVCTNGMSNSSHSSPWANAALVTTFGPDDYAAFGEGPFAGVAFQRHFEQLCFARGGSDYTAPAQRVPDFLASRDSSAAMRTSYTFGVRPGRLDQLLPERAVEALRRAIRHFDRRIPGFGSEEGILVGVEARSSGPVRSPREATSRRAEGFANLYPIGEGAGYAGGIMSAALDGARSAHAFLRQTVADPARAANDTPRPNDTP